VTEEEKEKEEEVETEKEQQKPAEITEEAEVEEKAAETAEEIPEKKEEIAEEEAVEGEEEEVPAPVAEEEAKPPPREEKIKEEEIVEERFYTIPLGKTWIMPPNKRSPRAVRIIKAFVTKHMKLEVARGEEGEEEEEPKRLVISNEVNERVWRRGIEKPPRKIRIRAAKDKEGNVTVYLAEGD
jgi:large subunit ribosomal protein L31e